MNDDILTTFANVGIILLSGVLFASTGRTPVSLRWVMIAALVFVGHDFFLTNGFGLLPKIFDGLVRNWQGKSLALFFSLVIANSIDFQAKRCGLTFSQNRSGRLATYTIAAIFLIGMALWAATGTSTSATSEDLIFQMTMPGLEEETFYRGILLFALDRAFPGERSVGGVKFGRGAALVAILFGFGHGFYFAQNMPFMDWWLALNTGLSGLLLLWLRLRTGSIVLPIIVHNFGNMMPLLLSGTL